MKITMEPVGFVMVDPWWRRHFDAAMAAKDSAGVSRFAKLFHPLGAIGPDIHVDNEIFMIYIIIYI